MAGTAENSEYRVVGWVYAFGERQANVQSDNSDPAARLVSERLWPNVRFTLPFQPVEATHTLNRSAGVSKRTFE